jgi:hypothetical protein
MPLVTAIINPRPTPGSLARLGGSEIAGELDCVTDCWWARSGNERLDPDKAGTGEAGTRVVIVVIVVIVGTWDSGESHARLRRVSCASHARLMRVSCESHAGDFQGNPREKTSPPPIPNM